MKKVSYCFSTSDIETCIFALSKLPLLHEEFDDVSEIQMNINESCALSASEKLSNGQQLTPNELRVTCSCITFCNGICSGDFQVSKKDYSDCIKYMFSLNKLDNELCSQI